MIDLDKKIIFTHHPKCGGTTIEAAFGWHPREKRIREKKIVESDYIDWFSNIKHAFLEAHMEILKDKNLNYKDFFKFTCVRNPWDLMVSRYFHDKHDFRVDDSIKKLTFDEFVIHRLDKGCSKKNKVLNFTPFLFYNNEFCMDYVIRFENYKEDTDKVLKKFNLKLPEKNYNVSKEKKEHYGAFYKNTKTIKLVEEAGKDVIELFGYEF